jgi:hypothetical protein
MGNVGRTLTPAEQAARDERTREEERAAIEAKAQRKTTEAGESRVHFGGRHSRQSGWKGPNR